MKRYVVIHKEIGQTPLAAIKAWKQAHPAYASVPASYAGRLDPMAEGKLLILLGKECKKQKEYTGLDKEYEIEILLDAGSDSGDALGLIDYANKETVVQSATLRSALAAERGTHLRPYPPFSSKTVGGKPLFLHALEGTIDKIEVPTHEERIYEIKLRSVANISTEALKKRLDTFLAKVPKSDEPSKQLGADFRIHAVQESWETALTAAGERSFALISLRVSSGSGTYMRALAGRIGEKLGTRGLALSITRTKIGKYWHGFWVKQF